MLFFYISDNRLVDHPRGTTSENFGYISLSIGLITTVMLSPLRVMTVS